jgi:hypothetical protein
MITLACFEPSTSFDFYEKTPIWYKPGTHISAPAVSLWMGPEARSLLRGITRNWVQQDNHIKSPDSSVSSFPEPLYAA